MIFVEMTIFILGKEGTEFQYFRYILHDKVMM